MMQSDSTQTAASAFGRATEQKPGARRAFQIALLLSILGLPAIGPEGSMADGNPLRQVSWLLLGLFAVAHVAARSPEDRRFVLHSIGLTLACLLVFALASSLWSTAPAVTLKRSVLLAVVLILGAAAFGVRSAQPMTFAAIIGEPLALFILMSLLYTAAFPDQAFMDIGWRGLCTHKNELGQVMGVGLLLAIFGRYPPQRPAIRYLAIVPALIAALLFTRSTTSAVGTFAAIATTGMLAMIPRVRASRQSTYLALVSLMTVLLIVYLGFLFALLPDLQDISAWILKLLGKSQNLTGRTGIWNAVLSETRFHSPLLGGGYGGFWVGTDSVSGYIGRGIGLYPGQAHNGYIDVYNDLGYIGLAILSVFLLSAFMTIGRLHASRHPEAPLHLSLLVMAIVVNYGESTFFRTTVLLNILLIASCIRVRSLAA